MADDLQSRLQTQMRKAYWDLLEKEASCRPLGEKTVGWIVQLYTELRGRLAGLTPRRADLHQELAAAMDTGALEAQLRDPAGVPPADLRRVVEYVYTKLLNLCAPAQDQALRCDRAVLLGLLDTGYDVTLGTFMVELLQRVHRAVDEIEAMIEQFRRGRVPGAGAGAGSTVPTSMRAGRG